MVEEKKETHRIAALILCTSHNYGKQRTDYHTCKQAKDGYQCQEIKV